MVLNYLRYGSFQYFLTNYIYYYHFIMEIDDGQLIELVRQFSILYDIKHKEYRNKEQKLNAWKAIGEVMNQPAADCETRWATLRTLFARESRKIVPSGSGETAKPWLWLKDMNFLEDHVRRGKTTGNVVKPSTVNEETENVWDTTSHVAFSDEGDLSQNMESENIVIEILPQNTEENTPKKRKFTYDDSVAGCSKTPVTPVSKPTLSRLRNECNLSKKKNQHLDILETINCTWDKFNNVLQHQKNENSDSPDIIFGKMVGSDLSKINDDDIKFIAKQNILEILHNAKK